MVTKKVSKVKNGTKNKKTVSKVKEVKTTKVVKAGKSAGKNECKIKMVASKTLSAIKTKKNKIIYALLILSILGFAPFYCYTKQKIARSIEESEGYKRAVFGWLKIVMTRKPGEKVKLEGDNLTTYNAIKDYAVRIADIYPSLRNLQIKAHVLTPVDSMGAINTYKSIISRAGKYDWCPICTDLIIKKVEKENYTYYYQIAKLYAKMKNKDEALKYIDISIEKLKKGDSAFVSKDEYKKASDMLNKEQAKIKKMSIKESKENKNTNKKDAIKPKK